MPNWKKVLISGSDAPVSAITASVVPDVGESAINLLAIKPTGEVVQILQQNLLQAGNDNLGDHTASAAAGLNMNGLPIYSASAVTASNMLVGEPSLFDAYKLKVTGSAFSGVDAPFYYSNGDAVFTVSAGKTLVGNIIYPTRFNGKHFIELNSPAKFLYSASFQQRIVAQSDITASGNISASGLLYASASEETTGGSNIRVLVYDTGSGRFYYTGSYNPAQPPFPFEGDAEISGSLSITGSRADGTIFEVYGKSTPIFEIIDSYDTLFQINDISGISRLKVDGNGHTSASRDVVVGENLYIKTIPDIGSTPGNILVADTDGKIYYTASVGGGGSTTPTLQEVTDQGSSTTTAITASIISASGTVYANGVQIGTSGSDSNGHLTIWRNSVDKQAVIAFPAFGGTQNDPGMIRHYNSGDTGIMEFSVSDQDGSNDKFVFGWGGYIESAVTPALTITADGRISASGDVNTMSAITGAFGLIDGGSF